MIILKILHGDEPSNIPEPQLFCQAFLENTAKDYTSPELVLVISLEIGTTNSQFPVILYYKRVSQVNYNLE